MLLVFANCDLQACMVVHPLVLHMCLRVFMYSVLYELEVACSDGAHCPF